MGNQKMTIAEQIRDYYLLGVYLMEEERSVGLGREKSTILDHLDNLRVRCLYLGLSSEYFLKSYLVKKGYSMKMTSAKPIGKKKKIMSKPAEDIDNEEYVVGYREIILTLKKAKIAPKDIPILKKLQDWRNSIVHKFYLKKINKKEIENAREVLRRIEHGVNPDLKLSTSIYITVDLDYRESNGGVRINMVNIQDNITNREEHIQHLFDVETHFGNIYVEGPAKKKIEDHVVGQLKNAGYLFKQHNFDIDVNEDDIERIEGGD